MDPPLTRLPSGAIRRERCHTEFWAGAAFYSGRCGFIIGGPAGLVDTGNTRPGCDIGTEITTKTTASIITIIMITTTMATIMTMITTMITVVTMTMTTIMIIIMTMIMVIAIVTMVRSTF